MSTFNTTKYTIWYYSIIDAAKARNPINDYTETHHIIPRSIGGSNDTSNLVKLTAREHFICHLLLTKMTNGQIQHKMAFALNSFRRASSNQQRILTSKQYELVRKIVSQARSESLKGNTYSKGIKRGPVSEETKEKIRSALKGKPLSDSTKKKLSAALTGKPKSEVTKAKMRKPKTKEHAENIRIARTGTTLSSDTKAKISASRKGKSYTKSQCPYCLRFLDPGNFKKNHGEKCKLKLPNS